MGKDNKSSGGIGLCSVVQIVFIILKVTKLINWKWSVVLIPLWIELGLIAVLLILVGISNLIDDCSSEGGKK